VLPLPNVTISKTTVAPCSLTRTPSLLRDGDDGLVFILCMAGQGDVRFGDDNVHLTPGAGTLVANHRLGGYFSNASATTCSLRIDRDLARAFAPSLDEAVLHKTQPDDPSPRLLKAYVETLFNTQGGLSASLTELADRQIRELLAQIINPASDLVRSGGYGGIKAARLQAVLGEIALHICKPGLSADHVGRRLGLSGRYVQQLMEGVGFTFSTYVRDLRLDRARQMLRDPRLAHQRITDICAMVGFADLSYFNRSFRARFGKTPRDTRYE